MFSEFDLLSIPANSKFVNCNAFWSGFFITSKIERNLCASFFIRADWADVSSGATWHSAGYLSLMTSLLFVILLMCSFDFIFLLFIQTAIGSTLLVLLIFTLLSLSYKIFLIILRGVFTSIVYRSCLVFAVSDLVSAA